MILRGAMQKSVVIIGGNSIIFNALNDNANHPIQLIESQYAESINNIRKIDLLIVDEDIDAVNAEIPFYRINSLVNLTSKPILSNEIRLQKPMRLNKLLDIISTSMHEAYLFCCINDNWLYHQRSGKIISKDTEISLTDKENDLLVELLSSKDFTVSKENLKKKIWYYHQDSESTTLETHLYKLKQKLPKDLLKIESTQCCLRVSDLI